DAQGWLFGRPVGSVGAGAILAAAGGRAAQVEAPPKGITAARGKPSGVLMGNPAPNIAAATGIDGVQRRQAVIVAADIVGFGRMLAHDEAGTVQAASELRRVVDPMIVAYRGRILGIAGESYMLEFVSAVDAVSWA